MFVSIFLHVYRGVELCSYDFLHLILIVKGPANTGCHPHIRSDVFNGCKQRMDLGESLTTVLNAEFGCQHFSISLPIQSTIVVG